MTYVCVPYRRLYSSENHSAEEVNDVMSNDLLDSRSGNKF
jgi:hypothetical protein